VCPEILKSGVQAPKENNRPLGSLEAAENLNPRLNVVGSLAKISV